MSAKCWSDSGNCVNSNTCQALDRCQCMPKEEVALRKKLLNAAARATPLTDAHHVAVKGTRTVYCVPPAMAEVSGREVVAKFLSLPYSVREDILRKFGFPDRRHSTQPRHDIDRYKAAFATIKEQDKVAELVEEVNSHKIDCM